jgi:hypothetical protein
MTKRELIAAMKGMPLDTTVKIEMWYDSGCCCALREIESVELKKAKCVLLAEGDG